MTDLAAALQHQNSYLHKVITAQAVTIDELVEAMQAGRCTLLPNTTPEGPL